MDLDVTVQGEDPVFEINNTVVWHKRITYTLDMVNMK